MKKLYKLSPIVMPTSEYVENTDLFLNKEERESYFNKELCKINILKFNTWMNIFPAKKYSVYCNIDDLYLSLELNQDSEVIVYGYNYNEAYDDNYNVLCKQTIFANTITDIKIESFNNYENIYFSILTTSNNIKINQAFWGTTTRNIRDNKLAIITCTFKRERFVTKNITLFKDFINKNVDIKDKIRLLVVDNGQTLDSSLKDDYVDIYPNKNTGGAGGFTRGIIEAKKSNENFTRILLMDDDVEVFPESFYRTLVLSNYLKPEYEESFIHGAMLNLYKKKLFFESTAIKTDDWCYSLFGELDISKQKNISIVNKPLLEIFNNEKEMVSSAWWYCCFSMNTVKQKGLPLPVFFRCDDLEWSWRNFGLHHISMSGISVWHSPFEWRVSKPVDYYFSKRNIAMINMLYTSDYKPTLLKMLKNDFLHFIKTYDYTACSIYIKMMKDLLKGSETFNKDPEITLKEVFSLVEQDKIEEKPINTPYKKLKKKYNKIKRLGRKYRIFVYKLKRNFWNLTKQGTFIPTFLWKKKKYIWSSAPSEEYMFCKKLFLLNFATDKVEIREYNRDLARLYKNEFNKYYQLIDANYKKLESDYKNAFKHFTTEEFWKGYLDI